MAFTEHRKAVEGSRYTAASAICIVSRLRSGRSHSQNQRLVDKSSRAHQDPIFGDLKMLLNFDNTGSIKHNLGTTSYEEDR